MARAWSGTGPLFANCTSKVLDCSLPQPGVVRPNPARPFEVPAVACDPSGNSTGPMLVFVGSACQLIRANNSFNCTWDNTLQAFAGDGCVGSGAPVQCACRHVRAPLRLQHAASGNGCCVRCALTRQRLRLQLTDFASVSTPSLPVCSLSDLTSLDAKDIITRMRLLFIVVVVLFGTMNLGALYGYALDRRQRLAFMARLRKPGTGCRVLEGGEEGTLLWRFNLQQLQAEFGAPTGSAVQLAVLMGLPAARLRAALPDDMLTWGLSEAVGRKMAFSASGFGIVPKPESKPSCFTKLCHGKAASSKMQSPIDADDTDVEDGGAPAEAFDCATAQKREEFLGTGASWRTRARVCVRAVPS
jgi:hypothetical protein